MLNMQPLKNGNWAFWERLIYACLLIVKILIYYLLNKRRLYVWRLHNVNILKEELCGIKAYELQPLIEETYMVNDHTYHSVTKFAVSV